MIRRRAAPTRAEELPPGPGTRAIDAHLDAADGGPAGRRWRPHQPHARPEQGPLDEITAHRVGDHWHLVTYGLTELDAKESRDPDVSGWGFELSLRVEPEEDDVDPAWATDLLSNLAAYVWKEHLPFAAGHHLALGGPIRLGTDTALTAAAVVTDPGVGSLSGPFGLVEVLQVVGLTDDELQLCRSWNTDDVIGMLARRNPLLVTRLGRSSLLDDPDLRAEAEERQAGDGASLTELRVATLSWERTRRRGTVLRLGSGAAAALGPALRRELIADGGRFDVIGEQGRARFVVGEAGWTADDHDLEIRVPLDLVDDLADLFDGRAGSGRRPPWPGLRFRVVA